jgi:hypothetical protein
MKAARMEASFKLEAVFRKKSAISEDCHVVSEVLVIL